MKILNGVRGEKYGMISPGIAGQLAKAMDWGITTPYFRPEAGGASRPSKEERGGYLVLRRRF